MSKPTLNPVLKPFWTTRARNKVLYGGRSSSKTWDASGMACFLGNKYKLKFLCTRQFQNRIEESVYTNIKQQIDRFNLQDNFSILKNKITNNNTGSEYIFYGLWRHIDEIKSTEGVDILWIEEAHNLTEEQWKVLEPTIRKESSEVWIIFNPNLVTDFVYQRFIVDPPKNTLIRKINYDENPFLSQTMIDLIEEKKEEDYDEYLHIYEGVPLEDDEDSIIKRSWVEAAIDAHIKLGFEPEGKKRVGFDVADDGNDMNALAYNYGNVIQDVQEWKGLEDELLKSCSRVYNYAYNLRAEVDYDAIGIGAFVGAKFKELNEGKGFPVKYYKYVAGGEVAKPDNEYMPGRTNRDFFENKKSQDWRNVSNRFFKTYKMINGEATYPVDELISISSSINDLEKLKTELSTPKKTYSKRGKEMVERKEDMLKRGVKSPNKADAVIMSLCQREHELIDYSKLV
jgi:phage terminase large subunit